jgi:bifunctional non-homologous end joining protein LigD
MIAVTNADRVVFPAVGRTKGDVVRYYERIAPRALAHLAGRPLSLKRFPKGLAGPGFFQKNVPDHYPPSIARFAVPRSEAATKAHPRKGQKAGEDVTNYPVVSEPDHLAYLANQGAIELHVPTRRVSRWDAPDRVVLDLDPPEGALDLVRSAALAARDILAEFGLAAVPVATGSKGYHVVAPVTPSADDTAIFVALQKVSALLTHRHPDTMTVKFRVNQRQGRVFVDWLRNAPNATVVAPYSLRARPRASVAVPLAWDELATVAPDAFTIDDVERLENRPDTLAESAARPGDSSAFVAAADAAFERAGLVLETFDRFRS